MSTSPPAEHPEYNATVTSLRFVHDDLMILRVEPDGEVPSFHAGQYTTLGLLTDERRIGEKPHPEDTRHSLVRRAYSICSPIVDDNNTLTPTTKLPYLEFYIALVRKDSDDPPSLTPRIFAMEKGHRISMGMKPKGTYTLSSVGENDNVVFLGTGTGEAPHNAMLNELLVKKHSGNIASFVCVRHKRDLGYLSTHQRLQEQHANYCYIPLTTREPENIDPNHANYVGKTYLQQVFRPDVLSDYLDWSPEPDRTHVFLCGNPSMIGAPKRDPEGHLAFPDPKGMIETLVELGFHLDQPRKPGNIHFERYW